MNRGLTHAGRVLTLDRSSGPPCGCASKGGQLAQLGSALVAAKPLDWRASVDPERLRRLSALDKLEEEWSRRHEKDQDIVAAFDPTKWGPGSDYNLHHVIMDASGAALDEFDQMARKILRGEYPPGEPFRNDADE